MLFNLCSCTASLASSAAPLCAGGAGFVTAVMATLAANARTRQAKTLRDAVPEVDRLAVRIVTDNLTQLFVPEETREGLTIERRVRHSYSDRPPRYILNAEWGLSIHAQSYSAGEERNVLVDFGFTPEVLNNNIAIIGIDPSTLDAMVLSHGHYDHFGGMVGFLGKHGRSLKKEIPFYIGGEDAFCLRRNVEGNFGGRAWRQGDPFRRGHPVCIYGQLTKAISRHQASGGRLDILSPRISAYVKVFGCRPLANDCHQHGRPASKNLHKRRHLGHILNTLERRPFRFQRVPCAG